MGKKKRAEKARYSTLPPMCGETRSAGWSFDTLPDYKGIEVPFVVSL
jgi:hypothetical protein